MTPQDLQQIIRDARQEAGITQTELAEMIGVGKPTVNQFETGNRNITVDILCKMLTTLHVELRPIGDREWGAFQQIVSLAQGIAPQPPKGESR